MRAALLSFVVFLAACLSARSRADRAFDRGEYLAAAVGYGELVAESPGDAVLRARRDDARSRALVDMATRVRQLRVSGRGEPALAALAELLAKRHEWIAIDDPAVVRAIADEVAASTTYVRIQTRALIAEQPLGAQEAIAARRAQLGSAELGELWRLLDRESTDAGQVRCRRVVPQDPEPSPYLARLTAAYCGHFGLAQPSPARLPDSIAGLSIEGAISGVTAEQRPKLEAALDAALRSTPWFDAGAAASRARIAVAGHLAVAYDSVEVELTAHWSESVSYQSHESYQEAYQESYQESYQEPYTVSVPYTEYRTESYSCGFGSNYQTCTRSVSSTAYRTETQYRTAYRTAFRTAYRTAWHDVTRWRAEPRSRSYPAIEQIGNYSGAWNLALKPSEAAAPLEVRIAHTSREVGYDHDASVPQANVEPSRAELPSFDDWFAQLLRKLNAEFPAQLAKHWSTSFCQVPSFSAESAARCAYGAPPPAAARAELAGLFGGDVDRVLARFAARSR